MIAAIYARKSTEQSGVIEEEKSVTRQIEHAKAYAASKGWNVSEEHIFVDDGVSGAEFVKRPGFIRLMNALKPRPTFHLLIMSEERAKALESQAKELETQVKVEQAERGVGADQRRRARDRDDPRDGPLQRLQEPVAEEAEVEQHGASPIDANGLRIWIIAIRAPRR